MNSHKDFILTPVREILEDVIIASSPIGDGIETYPLCEYTMQSVFLRVTGFQEQKMKCICWEMAAVDYDYRYEFTKKPLGECSSYKEKASIYKDLIAQIIKHDPRYEVGLALEKGLILSSTLSQVTALFLKTNLRTWTEKSFNEFQAIWPTIKEGQFALDGNNLFAEINKGISIKKIYENHVYRNRNRVAHNTQSYQQNLPTLKTLMNEEYKYENIFLWFAVLILIDQVFIKLYDRYLLKLSDLAID